MSTYQEIDGAAPLSGVDPFRLGPRMLAGILLCVLLMGGVGGWAVTVPLSGAVISQGFVVVDDSVQNIQHRDGGTVSEIAIHEGDTVQAGQLLFRIEDAQTLAELSIVRGQMLDLTARRARLWAERDGLTEISFPAGYGPDHPEAHAIAEGERRLFIGERTTRESQKQQLVLGIDQITKEVEGMQGQYAAKLAEMDLVEAEYQRTKEMTDRQLTEAGRLYAIDRERTRMDGELSEMVASIARARTKVSEISLQILAVDDTARTDAQRELAQVETRLSELAERAIALDDRLARTEIRAPRDGIVNELNIHTIGGVVAPGETLMNSRPPRLGAQRGNPAITCQHRTGQRRPGHTAAVCVVQQKDDSRTQRGHFVCIARHIPRPGHRRTVLSGDR